MILSRPQSATPSGVPQYEPQFVFVSRLPNSSNNTEEGNLPKPILRATISHIPFDFQNHQATTSSGHMIPQYNLHS